MNCGILAEATEWKENLWKLLSKIAGDGTYIYEKQCWLFGGK